MTNLISVCGFRDVAARGKTRGVGALGRISQVNVAPRAMLDGPGMLCARRVMEARWVTPGDGVDIVCLDLEGVLIPEIWVGVAEQSSIEALRRTTRDEPDYDKLMRFRLDLLAEHGLGIGTIQDVIGGLDPLPGASEFLAKLRERFQVVILSDTFYEFALPFMRKLAWPTLFCHRLVVSEGGAIEDYRLRQPDPKRAAVKSFHALRYRIIAAGDSYNDTSMLSEADAGILFRAPENVIQEFPQFPVTRDYSELAREIDAAATRFAADDTVQHFGRPS